MKAKAKARANGEDKENENENENEKGKANTKENGEEKEKEKGEGGDGATPISTPGPRLRARYPSACMLLLCLHVALPRFARPVVSALFTLVHVTHCLRAALSLACMGGLSLTPTRPGGFQWQVTLWMMPSRRRPHSSVFYQVLMRVCCSRRSCSRVAPAQSSSRRTSTRTHRSSSCCLAWRSTWQLPPWCCMNDYNWVFIWMYLLIPLTDAAHVMTCCCVSCKSPP